MAIVALIFKILLVTLGSVLGIVYLLAQMWQKVPSAGLKFRTYDYVMYGLIGFCFGVGLDRPEGLLAFVPLLLTKVFASLLIAKNRVAGKGRWVEVKWQKFTPRGFKLPSDVNSQLSRLPGDTHFIVPRFVSVLAVKVIMRSMKKNASKVPVQYKAQQDQAFGMIEQTARNIMRLDKGLSEKLSLPFGELKITRL